MKKKYNNGFFLSETMAVMAVVAIVIIAVFKIFSTTYTKYKESENYNTVNAINALSAVKKYIKGFEKIDMTRILDSSPYIEITDNQKFSSDLYSKVKEEYSIDSIFLINMAAISSNLSDFDVLTRRYINTIADTGIILLIKVNGNKYASTAIVDQKPTLIGGDSDNEYVVYLNVGDSFVDPGYTNWSGTPPTTSWENNIEMDGNLAGTYYLYYDFDGYIIRRKVVVRAMD